MGGKAGKGDGEQRYLHIPLLYTTVPQKSNFKHITGAASRVCYKKTEFAETGKTGCIPQWGKIGFHTISGVFLCEEEGREEVPVLSKPAILSVVRFELRDMARSVAACGVE